MTRYLISGPSGLVGSCIIDKLKDENKTNSFVLLTRNKVSVIDKYANDNNKEVIDWNDLCTREINDIDYVIHTAAPTDSSYFVNYPVETIDSIYKCTKLLLDKVGKKVKSFIYISSMEVYGSLISEQKVRESDSGPLSLTSTRSSYPLAKQLSELLCYSYFREYNIPVKIARPTLVIPEIYAKTDNRLIPYALKCIEKGNDIVLNTDGESKRDYISSRDLASALMLILEKGNNGETYNISNEETFCSINQMLEILLREKRATDIKIRHVINEKTKFYPKKQQICLDSSKLKNIGWKPEDTLNEMFRKVHLY